MNMICFIRLTNNHDLNVLVMYKINTNMITMIYLYSCDYYKSK